MANDLRIVAREAVVTRLRAALTGVQVYGEAGAQTAVWPFVKIGAMTVLPLRATGLDGSNIAMTIHCFAKGISSDAAAGVGQSVASNLDRAEITRADKFMRITWRGSPLTLIDPDGWHVVHDFEIDISDVPAP
jgi:Protein of unknown function (DUF3168)